MNFFKIKTGEEGKANAVIFVNIDYIKYVHCHGKNEAVPKSDIIKDAGDPYVEIFMGDGRRAFMFTKEEWDSKDVVRGEDI